MPYSVKNNIFQDILSLHVIHDFNLIANIVYFTSNTYLELHDKMTNMKTQNYHQHILFETTPLVNNANQEQ